MRSQPRQLTHRAARKSQSLTATHGTSRARHKQTDQSQTQVWDGGMDGLRLRNVLRSSWYASACWLTSSQDSGWSTPGRSQLSLRCSCVVSTEGWGSELDVLPALDRAFRSSISVLLLQVCCPLTLTCLPSHRETPSRPDVASQCCSDGWPSATPFHRHQWLLDHTGRSSVRHTHLREVPLASIPIYICIYSYIIKTWVCLSKSSSNQWTYRWKNFTKKNHFRWFKRDATANRNVEKVKGSENFMRAQYILITWCLWKPLL